MNATRAQLDALLADLNEPQRQAVSHRDGPLLVIAGPGSGKTRVITRRAAYLVHSGIPARNILAITFTNKAADEMRRRIERLGVSQGMWVYTFHALGVRLLREFGHLAGVAAGFSIYDETDALRVVKEALAAENISDALLRPDDARGRISHLKNRLLAPAEADAQAEGSDQQTLARVYATYQRLLEQRNAVDFDDLLMRVALVLQRHADITERLNIRFRYLLIDEYQDTNYAQYVIARELSRHHGNICATGDPDQSIYAWRGADIRNILEFEHDYPSAVVVRLEQNYRSAGHILSAASLLIKANRRRKHKDLWTAGALGEPVRVWEFKEDRDEAERIAETIASGHNDGRPWSDYAILYRINAVSRGLEESLRARGIPYKIVRGVEFYNRKEIRDVLAYLRVLVNPRDAVSLLRIINTPARGIGKTTIERLEMRANETRQSLREVVRDAAQVPGLSAGAAGRVTKLDELLTRLTPLVETGVADAVSVVLRESGLEAALREERDEGGEDRLANVEELVTAAVRYEKEIPEPSLADFLNRVSLTSDQDAVDEQAGVVLLMTLHAAKGLEFPVVFLVGLEHGLLPHERSLNEGRELEEERRLCFVGMTRAKERLYLSHATERLLRGQITPRLASRFLRELDDGCIERESFVPRTGGRPGGWHDDRFVPLVDDLPDEEAARLVPRRGLRIWRGEEETGTHEVSGSAHRHRPKRAEEPQPPGASQFATWTPGTLIRHAQFGVGQVVWIKPAPGLTRARVKFAGYGEKTLILEFAPVTKLERGPR